MTRDAAARSLAWALPMAALALFGAWRIGIFQPWTEVLTARGPETIPYALAGVDHPFHVARAETLRRSLADGQPLRWIGNHQGGYPAEFYPLGVAAMTVAAWLGALGQLPIGWAHGVTVALLLALPGVAFWIAAGRDRLPPAVALLAFTAHVVVPGAWWHGGYTELVQWGLATNVAGAAWSLLALVFLARWARRGARADGVLAAAAAAAALYCNTRSAFALATAFAAVLLANLLPGNGGRPPLRALVGRLAVAGAVAALLAAPLLVSLARFSGLYAFLHYTGYGSFGDWLGSTAAALSAPVAALAAVGTIAALLPKRGDTAGHGRVGGWTGEVSRPAAVALALYSALTLAVVARPELAPQLEATRMMPFQRLLMAWLAAVGAWRIAQAATHRMRAPGAATPAVLAALALALAAWWLRPWPTGSWAMPLPGPPDAPQRGLYQVAMTDSPSMADLARAVRAADRTASPGTALAVIGSRLSWHQQLWAPLWSDRPFLYDDWLWYWHPDHPGTPAYRFEAGHAYPDRARMLDPAYRSAHGIGGVAETGLERGILQSPDFEPAGGRPGAYAAWTVADPIPLLRGEDGAAAREAAYANGRISGLAAADGTLVAAHNWFPRWEAWIGGSPAPVLRTPAGELSVAGVEAGSPVEFRYGTDWWDWLARLLCLAGVAALGGLGLGRRFRSATGPPFRLAGPRRSAILPAGDPPTERPESLRRT